MLDQRRARPHDLPAAAAAGYDGVLSSNPEAQVWPGITCPLHGETVTNQLGLEAPESPVVDGKTQKQAHVSAQEVTGASMMVST